MRLLNRYIFRNVFLSILIVLLVMCSLDLLGKLVDELEDLSDDYGFSEVFIYTLLNTPLSIYKYMPFAVLVGSLAGLGSMANNSELIVMQSAGVSLLQISSAVLKPVLLLIFINLLLAEYIIPAVEPYSENRRALKLGQINKSLSSRGGLWNKEGNEYMHFNSVLANGRLLGITRYRFDDNNQLLSSSFSESAVYTDGQWQEEIVTETLIKKEKIEQQTFQKRPWNIQLSPSLLTILIQESDHLAISKLYDYIAYLNQQNIDSRRYQLTFWNKILQPLAIVGLLLLALSFIFGPLRQVSMGYRIFSGVAVGIVFNLVSRLFGPASLTYGFSPLIAVITPIVLCNVMGLILLSRKR